MYTLPDLNNKQIMFDAGVTCVGVGSKLISKDIIQNKDFDKLKQIVQETLQIIKMLQPLEK